MKLLPIRAVRRAFIGLALVVASCSDEPTTIADPSLIGIYVLSTVDGGPIPDSVTWSSFDFEFLAETLTVLRSGEFGVYTHVLGNDEPARFGVAGTVSVRGDSVVLTDEATRFEAAAGVELPDGIELRMGLPSFFWEGKVLRYAKLPDP